MDDTHNTHRSTDSSPAMPTAAEAAAAIRSAEKISVATATDVAILGRVLTGVGLAMGSVLILVRAAGNNTQVFAGGMLAYGLVIAVLMVVNTKAKAAPRGYARLYGLGIAGTTAVYAVGIAVTSTADAAHPTPWPLVVGLALATAVPAILCTRRIAKLAAR